MKKLAFVLVSVFLAGAMNAQTISFNPRTGDVEMDGFLKDISVKAKENVDNFVSDAVATFNIAKDKVESLIKIMDPADVFMTLQTAQIVNKPVDVVKDTYVKNKDKGWGEIAKEMGIKPGSKEFHALKGKVKGKKDKGNGNGNGNNGGNGKGKGKKK
jgi:hypothetical protein